MIRCRHCQTDNLDDSRYCRHCGRPLTEAWNAEEAEYTATDCWGLGPSEETSTTQPVYQSRDRVSEPRPADYGRPISRQHDRYQGGRPEAASVDEADYYYEEYYDDDYDDLPTWKLWLWRGVQLLGVLMMLYGLLGRGFLQPISIRTSVIELVSQPDHLSQYGAAFGQVEWVCLGLIVFSILLTTYLIFQYRSSSRYGIIVCALIAFGAVAQLMTHLLTYINAVAGTQYSNYLLAYLRMTDGILGLPAYCLLLGPIVLIGASYSLLVID